MEKDIFVSFSFKNQELAEKISGIMQDHYDYPCWICTKELAGGENYKDEIVKAIMDAKIVILILSEESVRSDDVTSEISMARNEHKTIIPFKIDGALLCGSMHYDLTGLHTIDGTRPSFEDRMEELARAIREGLEGKKQVRVIQVNGGLRSSEVSWSEPFYGREQLICRIHELFAAGHKTVFLKGMGGIGKSELARHYIKEHRKDYEEVVFVRCETDLLSLIVDDDLLSISGVGRKIKSDGTLQTDEEYARDKLKRLARCTTEKTLIVVDNYDREFDPYLDILCQTGNFRLLFTTRCEQDHRKYQVLPVEELADDDLRKFVTEVCKLEWIYLDPEDPGFDVLLEMTGRHTLTLELLAKYMCAKSMDSVETLVELMQDHGLASMADAEVSHDSRLDQVDHLIRDMFRMNKLSMDEKRFLHYLAVMPPAGVPQQYFRKWSGHVYPSARLRLLKLSLVKYDPEGTRLHLHPITRKVILENFELSSEECAEFFTAIAAEVPENAAWNYTKEKKELLTRCCLSVMECFPEVERHNFDAWYQMAVFLNFTDDYGRCIRRFQFLKERADALYGPQSPQSAQVVYRHGWLAMNRMRHREAQRYLYQALQMLEPYSRDYASDYIHGHCDLANALFLGYKEEGDQSLFDRAVETTQRAIDLANVAVAEDLCPDAKLRKGLAVNTMVKYDMVVGSYEKAEERLREALELYATQKDGYLDLASLTAKQGMLLARLDRPETKATILQAMEYYEQYGGSYSGTYYESQCVLVDYLEQKGELEEALRYAEKALQYAKRVYDKGHAQLDACHKRISRLEKLLETK